MKPVLTQKVYTFPGRKLYGEYDHFQLLELRLAIAKGEIKEQLYYVFSDDKPIRINKFGIPTSFSQECIEEKYTKMLMELLDAQMSIRRKEREI